VGGGFKEARPGVGLQKTGWRCRGIKAGPGVGGLEAVPGVGGLEAGSWVEGLEAGPWVGGLKAGPRAEIESCVLLVNFSDV
jgi:hypothetical protein